MQLIAKSVEEAEKKLLERLSWRDTRRADFSSAIPTKAYYNSYNRKARRIADRRGTSVTIYLQGPQELEDGILLGLVELFESLFNVGGFAAMARDGVLESQGRAVVH